MFRNWLWRRRARSATKPLRDEHEAVLGQVSRGTEDWLRWWRATGERELSCILMTAWDPIGVSDAVEAWGEYENYVPGVAYRLRDAPDDEAAAQHVAEYLNHVERDWMGTLNEQHERANGSLGETLVAWHEWSSVP
jgi:hypothetical protein